VPVSAHGGDCMSRQPPTLQIVKLVEYGCCPACGDKLRRRACINRSGRCGRDWSEEYRQAKKKEQVKS
jgi:hypothetical protein